MARLAQAIAAQAPRKGPSCTVAAVLAQLDKADADDLRVALSDIGIAATAITRALATLGHRVGSEPLRRHRRGECVCPR